MLEEGESDAGTQRVHKTQQAKRRRRHRYATPHRGLPALHLRGRQQLRHGTRRTRTAKSESQRSRSVAGPSSREGGRWTLLVSSAPEKPAAHASAHPAHDRRAWSDRADRSAGWASANAGDTFDGPLRQARQLDACRPPQTRMPRRHYRDIMRPQTATSGPMSASSEQRQRRQTMRGGR